MREPIYTNRMKKGEIIKLGLLTVLFALFVAVLVQTPKVDYAEGEPAFWSIADTLTAMGDAPDPRPEPPPLIYSSVYEEVSQKKRTRPSLRCRAALVVDNADGTILYAKREREIRAIASLSKLMTAMVYLDCDPDLTRLVMITKEDAKNSAKSGLRRGETFVAIDLLHAALMSSDNRAARALVRASGKSKLEFVRLMNKKAKDLGLENTRFVEVTGLSQENVSNAYECALLLNAALEYDLIREITTMQRYSYRSLNKGRRHRATNSNRLIFSRHKISGGKTGYILRSGYCLATRAIDKNGRDITAIILGAPTNNQRFYDADKALRWGYKNAS